MLMSAGSIFNCSARIMVATVSGAVAPERRVQRDHDLAKRIDLDADPLGRARQRKAGLLVEHPELGRREHAALLAGGDADPDIAALLAILRLLSARSFIVEQPQRLVEH